MEILTIISKTIFAISVILVFLKVIIGFHFPWEKCSCCGKRLDKNHVPLKSIKEIEEEIKNEFKKWDASDKAWEESKQRIVNQLKDKDII